MTSAVVDLGACEPKQHELVAPSLATENSPTMRPPRLSIGVRWTRPMGAASW